MRGSVTKREGKVGTSWRIQVYLGGKDADGRPRRYFETIHSKNKGPAQTRLNDLLVSLEKGTFVPTGKTTLADHLKYWLDSYVKIHCSLRTVDSYESIAKRHVIPALGNIELKQLHPATIQSYYTKALENVSARTVAKHHRLLAQSLRFAVRQGILGLNPCDRVSAPSWTGKQMRTLT